MGGWNPRHSVNRITATARLVKFEHTVFALPFALAGGWIAADGRPPWADLGLLVLAAIFARTAAMGWNRVVDLPFDALNPRTASRELVTGTLSSGFAKGLVLACSLGFLGSAFLLSPLCGWLAFPALGILLGYSHLKRFTFLCHAGLGIALGLAPAGAWLAVAKDFLPGWEVPLWIGLGCACWTTGFDLFYSIQDLEVDRRSGLKSIPARWGAGRSRVMAAGLHIAAVAAFAWAGFEAGFSLPYFLGVGGCGILLTAEHALLMGGRIDRIPIAFFKVNSWVGMVFFAGVLAQVQWGNGAGTLGS